MITLYFDETNNHRAVSIKNGKLNIPDDDKDFVLGGIGIRNHNDAEEIRRTLISSLGFNEHNTPSDIKLKTIAQGDFLDCLKSRKLKELISTIKENKILIHYHRTNLAFWNTLDIIESLTLKNPRIAIESPKAKEELTTLYRKNKAFFIELFEKYKYPSIEPENIRNFYSEIYRLCAGESGLKSLKKFLKIGTKTDSAEFIQDNDPGVLIGDFANSYIHCIKMHKNYRLVFDEEGSIKEKVAEYFNYTKQKIVYEFVKKDLLLQISDVVIGLLGKLYEYINKKDMHEIKRDLILLNPHQLEIISDLHIILNYTQNIDGKLGFETAPMSSVDKHYYVLTFKNK